MTIAGVLGTIEVALGLTVVGLVVWDVFHTVVLPRPSPTRFRVARAIARLSWPIWRRRALSASSTNARERMLGSYGPGAVLVILVAWIALLILGFGLVLHAVRDQVRPVPDLAGSIYFAGTAVLTIGFGDLSPEGPAARAATVVGALLGLGTIALGITYLFSLYGSFQRRESLIVRLEARAGAPPSGIALLETYAPLDARDGLAPFFLEWETWAAELLDTHVAYPILTYFRSSHDNVSWVSALGAVLDASALVLTTVGDGPISEARHVQSIGQHCVEDLAGLFGWTAQSLSGVEESEFLDARARLVAAGWPCREPEGSWQAFQALRVTYAARLNAMAVYWLTPPALWIGDRSMRPSH